VTWSAPESQAEPSWTEPAAPSAAPGEATYGRRVAATLIDLVLSSIAFFAVFFGFAVAAGIIGTSDEFDDDYGIPGAAIAGYLLAIFLPILLMLRPGRGNGQTLGKELLGIRVTRLDGAPVRLGTALLRELLGKLVLGITGVWILVDNLWPLADARNQALHDKLASTVVLDASARPAAAPPQPNPFGG
jgi:uncharacterized RDD family membrane protein YckC